MFGQLCELPLVGGAPWLPLAGGLCVGAVVVVPLLVVLGLLGVVDDDVAAFAIAAPPAAIEPVMASVVSRGLSLRIGLTSFLLDCDRRSRSSVGGT
jgi:hypothetical protein